MKQMGLLSLRTEQTWKGAQEGPGRNSDNTCWAFPDEEGRKNEEADFQGESCLLALGNRMENVV